MKRRPTPRAADAEPQPLTVPWFKDRIEAFAPAHLRDERAALYSDLESHAGGITVSGLDGFAFILGTIAQAQIVSAEGGRREPQERRTRSGYWRRRDRLEAQLQGLQADPLMRSLDWDFFGPGETCPHGRHRRECEDLHSQRENFILADRPPLNRTHPGFVARLRKERAHMLDQAADTFCRPAPYGAPEPSRTPRGRPRDILKSYLVENLRTGPIDEAGKSLSFDTIRAILMLCFGEAVSRDALSKLAERLSRSQ